MVQEAGPPDRSRLIAAACLACAALAIAAHPLPSGWWTIDTAKVITASLTLLFVPGVLTLLICRLESPLTLLEMAGGGAALSVGITALLTILCMMTHTAFSLAAIALVAGAIALGVVALRRQGGRLTSVQVPASDLWLVMALAVLGALLFLRGAPLSPGEDQIHMAVARRLAALSHPSVSNIYMTPGLVYTYPFPTTHALFSLTSLIGGVDVLFVYHKLRYVWSILAIVCVYVSARRLFDDAQVAGVCGWTAITLVANGVFADVPPLMWAQLAPFSHATDVAMGVLLPLLLVSAFSYLSSTHRRDRFVFLAIAMLMVLALTTAHIKELIQFLVYLVSLLAAVLILGPRRELLSRTALLLCATVAVVGAYMAYHRLNVESANSIVEVNRTYILEMWRKMTPRDYFVKPLNDGRIVNNFHLFYSGVNALVLLAMPVACVVFRRKPLLLLVWASVLAYFVIVRFPIVSIAYLLSTYFDMLSGPVRNVIFFIYVMAGALVFIAARLCSRVKPWVLGLAALVALAWAAPRAAVGLREFLPEHSDALFGTLLVGLPLAFWAGSSRWGRKVAEACSAGGSPARFVTSVAVFLVALGVTLLQPHTVLAAWKTPVSSNVAEAMASAKAPLMGVSFVSPVTGKVLKADGTNDVPTVGLVNWMNDNIPPEAVSAVNLLNGNILTTFFPQQVPAWPLAFHDPTNYCLNFPRFCETANATVEKYGVQPLFNDREDRGERISFLKSLAISWVIVDPSTEAMMIRVLGQYPDLFSEAYSDGGWRVFRVTGDGL